VLWCAVTAGLLCWAWCRQPPDTAGWTLTDFTEHALRRGVPLRAIPGSQHAGPYYDGYLTEDPDATWRSLQLKPKTAEHAHLWRGTVWVGQRLCDEDAADTLAHWGGHGGRVGTFLIFGDEWLIRRIRDAWR
jgi:hypothetical protein